MIVTQQVEFRKAKETAKGNGILVTVEDLETADQQMVYIPNENRKDFDNMQKGEQIQLTFRIPANTLLFYSSH